MQKKENLKKRAQYQCKCMTYTASDPQMFLQNNFVDAGQIFGVIIDAAEAQHCLAQHQHEEQPQTLLRKVSVRVHFLPIREVADKHTRKEVLCTKEEMG